MIFINIWVFAERLQWRKKEERLHQGGKKLKGQKKYISGDMRLSNLVEVAHDVL
jgi:hypothetical protein